MRLHMSSDATDLAPGTTTGGNIFVRDMKKRTTTLVTVAAAGAASGNGRSSFPVLSANGRFVAFTSEASNLVTGDTNGKPDIFVRDLTLARTTLVSVAADGSGSGDGLSFRPPSISADGSRVAFQSSATKLSTQPKSPSNQHFDVFVRDLRSGTTTRVSVNASGTAGGDDDSQEAALSRNGRVVAFESTATDLVTAPTHGLANVYVRDLATQTTTLVSANRAGTSGGDSESTGHVLSADGRWVAFTSLANDLVPNDTVPDDARRGCSAASPPCGYDVCLRDAKTGTTTLVSVNRDGTNSGDAASQSAAISADGRYVAFWSLASDLVPQTDTGFAYDLFVRDVRTRATVLVDVNLAGTASAAVGAGDGSTPTPALSANGAAIAFESVSNDLVATPTSGVGDVFVRTLR